MKKIPTIFIRNEKHQLTAECNSACLWVFNGEGIATRKFDGTAMRFQDGVWSKRYDCKTGRTAPAGFESADEPDAITGHWPGWVPITGRSEDKWFRAAIQSVNHQGGSIPNGTYEAIGPHFSGNPELAPEDTIVRHGIVVFTDVPLNFNGLADYLKDGKIEGKDYGFRRA